MKRVFLCTITLIVLYTSCIKKECYKTHLFKYPVSIYPDKDTFSIGDTIWVEMNIDNIISDKSTGEKIDISSLELQFVMFNSRYDIEYLNNSASNFDFYVLEGQLNFSSDRGYISFSESDDKKFKVALIPKISGGQVLVVSPRLNNNDDDTVELGSRCVEIISRDSHVEINNNVNNNVEYLNDLYIIYGQEDTIEWLPNGLLASEVTNHYVFYVR